MKFEEDKALYKAPLTSSESKYLGQGVIGIGLVMLIWALDSAIHGYHFSFTGRGALIDLAIVRIFGMQLGEKIAIGIIASLGIVCLNLGWKSIRPSKKKQMK